jgi:hypothetical protein
MRLMTSRRSILFAGGLILAFQCALGAASAVDQSFEQPANTIPTIFSNYRWAQTFTVGSTGTLTQVDVLFATMFRIQNEDLDVTIFDTAGGVPRAALTAPFHIPRASVPLVPHPTSFDQYAWLSAQFALPVTAGDVLAIVVSTGPTSQYYWAGKFEGGYPGGRLYGTQNTTWSPEFQEDQLFRTWVNPSRPPTANAGSNQTLRPGVTVNLDGSGSFDDDTDTNLLQYSWSLVSVPDGSTMTALTNANTATPSFLPDVHGNYVVQLVVTDEDGLSSQPSLVTIGENLPPVAEAGPDQIAIVNESVGLYGSATDLDNDAITYSWQFTKAPAGSTAQPASPTEAPTFFTPDRPGVYVATLTPSDFLGTGTPASMTITVITATRYAEMQLLSAAVQILQLPPSAWTSRGNRAALLVLLARAVVSLQRNDIEDFFQTMDAAVARTDGCAINGSPDASGPNRDWITSCEAQDPIYFILISARSAVLRSTF